MTEAIDEQMLEEQAVSRIQEDSYMQNSNRYPEQMQNMSAENYFRYRNPKPTALDELIEVETSVMQVSKMQSQNNFEDNPNIENVIKKLENKNVLPITK
jgi:hypothetical protein